VPVLAAAIVASGVVVALGSIALDAGLELSSCGSVSQS